MRAPVGLTDWEGAYELCQPAEEALRLPPAVGGVRPVRRLHGGEVNYRQRGSGERTHTPSPWALPRACVSRGEGLG